ncbi:MAG: hypothetical protein LBT84_01355, partial [Spirochaetia bacterium]|nr:hypothetical protein [Spirochaetia bacterium]
MKNRRTELLLILNRNSEMLPLKNKIIFCLFVLILSSCAKKKTVPEIDQFFNLAFYGISDKKALKTSILISSASIEKAYKIRVKDSIYYVIINDQNNVCYIQTSSKNFKTEDGLSVDSSIMECIGKAESEIMAKVGVHFYVQLPSGWKAVIGDINTDLENT